jgi:hypothetical protein
MLSVKKSTFRNNIFKMLDNLESNDPKAFWSIYEDLCDKKKSIQNPISPKQWWSHFLTLMNRNLPHNDTHFEDFINDYVRNSDSFNNDKLDHFITESEVITAARLLKKGKSAGMDGIRPEMLKAGISSLALPFANLFNVILKNGSFPSAWRLSSLTVIHKKGDKATPKNYRGIAVSSNLCKLFCLVLYNRINTFVDDNGIVPSNQIGFRKGSRTSDHIFVLKSLIDKYINRAGQSYLYVCFIDFSAAFDTVWRNGLIYKLTQIGVGGNFLTIIKDMYSSVLFAIKCDGKVTDSFQTTVGVKQGCILSPLFFNIFLSDLPNIFDLSCDPVNINNLPISCLMYADDMIILSESSTGLQNALDKLHNYCSKWKLVVNIDKSNIMIFNKGGFNINKYKFNYGNVNLKITNEYCYLGIVFVPSGSFSKAMLRLQEKATKAYFKIRHNLSSSSYNCSIKLFTSLIQPILSYGSEVWAPYLLKTLNNTNFLTICDKLPSETLHIKVCKLILGVHKKATNNAVRGELGRFPILITMLSLAIKYWWSLNDKCMKGCHSLVIDALIDNRKLCDTGIFSWSSGIKGLFNLINRLDIWNKPNCIQRSSINNVISSNLELVYSNLWYNHINNLQVKLRSYCLFKKSFSLENYVVMFYRSARSHFTKLRISAHNLMIEKGRHVSPKIEPHNRICTLCNLNSVEDEFHFIMECPFYSTLRIDLLNVFSDIYNLNSMSNIDIFKLIMSVSDYDCIIPVIKYVRHAFEARQSIDI